MEIKQQSVICETRQHHGNTQATSSSLITEPSGLTTYSKN